ncbi:MAG: MFS transporter, partial [Pseudomonadota bacterium]|nr:MFS transporter [Pseudomonadota bacterium]
MISEKSIQQSTSVNEFARGWTVLFAAFVGIGVSLTSMVYYATGIWVRPWQEEFGWTRAEIGAQQSISVLVLMLLATFAGRLIDLYGLRNVTTISLLGYGLLLLGFTQMTGDLWMLYALSAACAVLGVASTALAFTRAVNAFFIKYLGLALGISLTSAGIMAYLMPRFMTPFVAENGWRAGYVVMFFIVMAALPIVYLLIRDAPDDDGLDDATIAQMQTGLNLGAALRTVLFWKIAGIFFLVARTCQGSQKCSQGSQECGPCQECGQHGQCQQRGQRLQCHQLAECG